MKNIFKTIGKLTKKVDEMIGNKIMEVEVRKNENKFMDFSERVKAGHK